MAAVFARAFLPSPLTRVVRRHQAAYSRLEQTGLLRLAAQRHPSRATASSGRSVPTECSDSAMVAYTVRLRPHYLHKLVWPLPFTVELQSSWHRMLHAVVRPEA
ncbi:hypothetical protein T03_11457 [Trichinella britovi]|uniref:Uncharacterized protein n=1 Tax=Trichinella britovi TaxID=45882 RepID=A0A0V1AQB3_TRIBR|nr:hypothetical protein T03_11457 [Trichinella britovi]